MTTSDPLAPQPASPDSASAESLPTLAHNCLTTDQLAKRWGKSKCSIWRMNDDPDHPLKAAAFSKRPLYFPERLVRMIEEGYARPPQ